MSIKPLTIVVAAVAAAILLFLFVTTTWSDMLAFTVIGLVIGSAYAIASSGLVITYATSNVFNMAHGAVGMVMAFLYWELAENRGLPAVVALLLVVGVAAPLFGAIIERVMMRRLTDASATVSLTVTVGLLVALIGIAQTIWPPVGRRVEELLPGAGVQIGQVFVTGQDIITFVIALGVAGALWYLLNQTRTGIGMRAIVDNRGLLALHGAKPSRLSMLSWALGSSLAALAGILLVSRVQLDYITLTLLVVNAYAAAMVGKLKNLPRTIIGAMVLGLLQAYFLLLSSQPWFQELPEVLVEMTPGLRAALPTIFLFIVMMALPLEKLRVGQVQGATLVRAPSWRRAFIVGAVFIVAVLALTMTAETQTVARLGQSLSIAAIMLSLVLITGYGGDVSLAQMTFAGLGALFVIKGVGPLTEPGVLGLWSLLVAGAFTAAVGAIVALPALRLRGLYLGLGTLAFAYALDKLIFESGRWGFELGGAATVQRPQMLGVNFEGEGPFTVFVAVALVAIAYVIIAVRRGRFGRLILATRDSPAACGTLGLNITTTRVLLFALSAGLAGVAGALYGGMFVQVGATNFAMFQSLPILLLAVVGGITSITGAVIGGVALGFAPSPSGVDYFAIGAAAILVGRYPNGLAGFAFAVGRKVFRRNAQPVPATTEGLRRPDVDAESQPEEVTAVAAS